MLGKRVRVMMAARVFVRSCSTTGSHSTGCLPSLQVFTAPAHCRLPRQFIASGAGQKNLPNKRQVVYGVARHVIRLERLRENDFAETVSASSVVELKGVRKHAVLGSIL